MVDCSSLRSQSLVINEIHGMIRYKGGTMNIAIDGPAGAGKSTIAKLVAKNLGSVYVDTGAMYRAMALFMIKNSVDPKDIAAIEKTCENADISITYEDGAQHVILNGEDVTSVVMDGRDIGTVVLPDAECKIYLTASTHTRALRRYKELLEKAGGDESKVAALEEIEKDIADRDYRDMHRENSPLMQADDAHLVDSSDMTIDEVVREIMKIAEDSQK